MPQTFDLDDGSLVLIIGSGAGGGTLGNELAQKGIRTLILEAGPRLEREQHIDDERQSFAQLTLKFPKGRRRATLRCVRIVTF